MKKIIIIFILVIVGNSLLAQEKVLTKEQLTITKKRGLTEQEAKYAIFEKKLAINYFQKATEKDIENLKKEISYAIFDYAQFEMTKEEWEAISTEEKDAVMGCVGYDVNEFANNSEIIKNQERTIDSLNRVLDSLKVKKTSNNKKND